MSTSISLPIERYLGIDLHKHYLVIGGVNAKQEVVLPPRRVELGDWPKWATTHLRPTDVVVVEATTNAWDFYDVTSPLVQRVIVANAAKIALIARTRTKTDNKDVMVLARLLAAGLIPEVWVPPMEVRELRSLISHRRRVVGARTSLKNRLQSVHASRRHHLVLPSGDPFSAIHRAWWDTLPVSPTERLHLKHDPSTSLRAGFGDGGPTRYADRRDRRRTAPPELCRAVGRAGNLPDAVAGHRADHGDDCAVGHRRRDALRARQKVGRLQRSRRQRAR
ncbi:MAG TPA: transposase [Anaerolineales bacterium]|nr:transposase [Anaerolineales bacterium]